MIGEDDRTRQSELPTPAPDEQPTAAHSDVGIVAELRALFGSGDKLTLPLYALPDQIVVGRGSACDWQLDDPSLSRKHCQFRWNGEQLTVEDLGSANGTRVAARSARQPLPVGPDDVVQLGTVMISFVLLQSGFANASPRNVDAETTRLVAALTETTPGPSAQRPLSAVATVVKAPVLAGPPNLRAAVFHPERDAAAPDEPTRPWDANAVLAHAPEKNLDAAELLARLKSAWRTHRRPWVLGGAAAWILLLLGLIALKQPRSGDDDQSPPPASRSSATPPRPPAVARVQAGGAAPASERASEPSTDRDQDLADGIAAYDNGRPKEALKYFRRLATDPSDQAAKFMVRLIEARAAGTP